MKRSRLLGSALVLTLAATLTAAKCDQAQLDRACVVDPTLPFCKPSPSTVPSSQPTPEPSPSAPPEPVPSPSATPAPSPMPSPTPTPVPTPEPSPTPSPVQDCIPHPLPDKPVPLVRGSRPGPGWRCDTFNGVLLCAGRTAASDSQEWRTPAGDDCLRGSLYVLQSHNHEGAAATLKRGMVYDPQRGFTDAFCRRSLDGETLLYRGSENPDNFGYTGNLPPVYCGTPSPSPAPSATPSSTPGSPTPVPTPATCPPLRRWSTSTPAGEPGARRSFDSTPRFGESANGLPCNSDHHAVCSLSHDDHEADWRHCEDPRGGRWEVRGGDIRILGLENPGVDGLGFRANTKGSGQIQVCPPPNLVDEEGAPVRILGDGCSGWKDVP